MVPALILAIVLSGGISYAAEGAVPGDILYPVKTEINENIRSAVAFSTESEGRVQVQLAQHRLEEASELSAEGKLTSDVASELAEEFAFHANNALDIAAQLKAQGKTEAAAALSSKIETVLSTNIESVANARASSTGEAQAQLNTWTEIGNTINTIWAKASQETRTATEASTQTEAEDSSEATSIGASAHSSSTTETSGNGTTSVKGSLDVNIGL